jgi:hypothetical protein
MWIKREYHQTAESTWRKREAVVMWDSADLFSVWILQRLLGSSGVWTCQLEFIINKNKGRYQVG